MNEKEFEQELERELEAFDYRFIMLLRKHANEVARVALFIIFFWFGILKVFALSPAGPLVVDLLEVTFLKGTDPQTFLALFGLLEVLIGIMVLVPKLERITFLVLLFHMVTTVMPLFLLTSVTWDSAFVPTLTGQYIIKNVALLSLSLLLFARLRPMTETHSIAGEEVD